MIDSATKHYPWHDAIWASLTARIERLPHALLLQGAAGLGKQSFARRFAATLLCAQPDSKAAACGRCHSCQLLAADNHPDLKSLAPAEDRRSIVIDQVRELGAFLALRPHTSACKVAILAPADSMNLHAANSLLKILEEPPLGSVLLLVSHQPTRLPATVRSRGHRVTFPVPERAPALAWLFAQVGNSAELLLDLAAGAPLKALALAEGGFLASREEFLRDVSSLLAGAGRGDPLACAQRWKGAGTEASLEWLTGFVADLVWCLTLGNGSARVLNQEAAGFLQKHKNVLYLKGLFKYLDAVSNARNGLASGSLDELLILEDLLIRWCYMEQETPTITNKTRAAS
ncbi:MAG: DNA polymerase III subunit delta' [Gammaproteobacteria bacterium]|nr:DNA polymerase III subunit delta' [Gammaproteobacteria bacterium]